MTEPTTQATHFGTCPSDCSPLPATEQRNEVLTFRDGSEMEINAQMRRNHPHLYADACRRSTGRRMVENAELAGPEAPEAPEGSGGHVVATCPECGASEIEAYTPRTCYECGSYDYDQRPGTYKRGANCNDKDMP